MQSGVMVLIELAGAQDCIVSLTANFDSHCFLLQKSSSRMIETKSRRIYLSAFLACQKNNSLCPEPEDTRETPLLPITSYLNTPFLFKKV